MSFTPKIESRPVVRGILTIAVVGLIGLAGQFVPKLTPIGAAGESYALQQIYRAGNEVPLVYAVETLPAAGVEGTMPNYYQPVSHWYKSKHWWKRNAPIIGGAGGGALIGGLAGGGTGALIGGAVGGGGGYAYKRLSHRHNHHHHQYQQPQYYNHHHK
jgi:hypothetical protein